MNSRHYVREKKRMVDARKQWEQGPIPKRHFPLFKEKKPLGPDWWWRTAALRSQTAEYRLLVSLRQDKPNFKAWLAVEVGGSWACVARLESHGHHGLHCHYQCPNQALAVGQAALDGMGVLPNNWRDYHRRDNQVMSVTQAWQLALRFFRAQTAETGELGL